MSHAYSKQTSDIAQLMGFLRDLCVKYAVSTSLLTGTMQDPAALKYNKFSIYKSVHLID